MVRRTGDVEPEPNVADRDERIGEAIEAYLTLAEAGQAPEPSSFAAGYPELEEDLLASLEGLALVQGLVGETSGPGHRLESGRRVAGYRIVRELGRGGMGIVYEAVHVGLDRPVALKVLGSSAAPDSSGRRRFLNEARTAAGLHHTHIVPVFDVGQVGGLCYYAMQRIEGSGLDRVIKHLRRDRSVAAGSTYPGRALSRIQAPPDREIDLSGRLGDSTATWAGRGSTGLAREQTDDEPTPFEPPRGSAYYRWVATVGRQAAEALAHAHQRGVIHRDVKPSNLLVDARGTIWMADFGLARRLADPSQTQVDSLLGTPRYMSPEQANTGAIDGRSDVYSLGATLYELLTLRPPFEGKTAAELIGQIASRDPAPVRQFDKKIPRDLETIVLKALHKRAQDRYETAADLADDLERYLNHEPVRARRIGPIGRAWRVARRNRLLTTISALAIAAVLISTTINYVNILYERNEAIKARGEAQKANEKLEIAIGETQQALRSQLVQNAEVVRLSAVADRRATGLDLLKRAALLPSAPDQRTLLRDEAVAFLTIRDVEGRPGIPLPDPSQTFVFAQDGQHLATLADDGATLRFWDVEKRTLINTQEIAVDLTRGDDGPRGRGPRRFGAGPGGGRPPNRDRVASAGEDIALIDPDGKGIRLFNAATGAVSGNLRLYDRPVAVGPAEPEREILAIAFSADGQRFLTVDRAVVDPSRGGGGGPGGNDPRNRPDVRVHLWNALKPARPIATVFESKADTRNDPFMRGWPPLVALAPDGKTVAVASVSSVSDAEISIWTKDGTVRDTIDSQADLTALAIGSEGLLAAAGNRAVHLWDLHNLDKTKASFTSLNPNLGLVDQLRFSPDDSSLLAVSGRGSGVELWDISATAKVASLPIPGGDWHGMAIGPKNKLLAIAQGSALALWEVVNPQALIEISSFPDRLKSVTFSPGGDLAMVDGQGNLRLWTKGECAAKSHINEFIRASSLTFDHQGRLIVQIPSRVDPRGRPVGPSFDRLDWLDPAGLKTFASIPLPEPTRFSGNRGGGGFRLTSPRIARASNDQMLVMTRFNEILLARPRLEGSGMTVVRLESADLADGTPPQPPDRGNIGRGPQQPRPATWRDVAVSPTGTRVYLLSGVEEFSAWSLRGTRLERLGWSIPGRFSSMALSDDGCKLALGDRQGSVQIVDAETGRILQRLSPPQTKNPTPVDAIAFAPDQSALAVGTSGQVRLWTLHSTYAQFYMRLFGHRGPVTTLAFDPSGDRLATGGADRSVRVWDLKRVHVELNELGLDR